MALGETSILLGENLGARMRFFSAVTLVRVCILLVYT